jgi:hypothetical protein
LLEPALDDAVTDVEQTSHSVDRKKRGGINPRLLAVLMMVLVVSGAGYFLLNLKRSAALEAPLEPPANRASTDPVLQQPPASAMPLTVAPSGGGDILAAATPSNPIQASMPSQPTSFVPDTPQSPPVASQPPTNPAPSRPPTFVPAGQSPSAAIAPQNPPAQSAVPPAVQPPQRNAANESQMRGLIQERDRLAAQNRLLEDRVRKLETAQPNSPAKAGPKTASGHAGKTETAKGSKKNRDRDDEIVTESRDTKIATMSVRAVYPLSGRNARAWVNVGGDLVEVSAGSSIDGIKVRSINPELLEVVTDVGVIRAAR